MRKSEYLYIIYTFKSIRNILKLSNEVFLRVTNHTGQAEKNLHGPAGIPAGPSRFFSTCPVWFVTRRNTSLLFSTRVHCPIIIKFLNFFQIQQTYFSHHIQFDYFLYFFRVFFFTLKNTNMFVNHVLVKVFYGCC